MEWVTVALFIFGLVVFGRRVYARILVVLYDLLGGDETVEAAAPAPAPHAVELVLSPIDPATPMHPGEWLRLLNDEPNVIPHLAAYGPSGAGKSTFILALLHARAGQLVITTMKNAADDPWGGFPAVRLGFRAEEDGRVEPDWSCIAAAIEAVYREVNLRHADGSRPRTPLTLVVDELTATIAALGAPRIVPRLIHMWLTARSVGVRLIVMDPTANVKGWGLEGRGDVRESIGFIRLDRDRTALFGSLEETRANDGVWLDTADVPRLAGGVLSADRAWAIPDTGISVVPGAVFRADTTPGDDTGTDTDAEILRLALETDLSANKIYERVGGNRNRVLRAVAEARGYRSMREA